MAGIPLRSYIREIEKHIESGRNDEAIAHCRYILEIHPMYTDTYRLLGKAFLESQRYGDAADIFQRVLSSIPDDFVAHVGMSIIREDEGNLDEAIWHMERAFEIQPANSAIQDELKRLFGRRDGVEPPKIRLTRGALARMYFKGGLYQQAIAETRTALAENPNRLDLQVLLAEIYDKTGQRAEAADTANSIITKIPYCLVANQIMVSSLSGTGRDQETQTFRQRLNKLDPYTVFIGPNNPNAASVPDQAITLEKLDWKPGQMIGKSEEQPAWASSLGVEIGEVSSGKEEHLPEWLAGVPEEKPSETREEKIQPSTLEFSLESLGEIPPPGQPAVPSVPLETTGSEEELPDWIKAIGEEVPPGEVSEVSADLEAAMTKEKPLVKPEEGDLASAEIPDWLRAMAPIPGLEGTPEAEGETTPWIHEIVAPDKSEVVSDKWEPTPEIEATPEGIEIPDWLVEEPELTEARGEEIVEQQEVKIEGEEITPEGEVPTWLFEGEEHPVQPLATEDLEISTEELPGRAFEEEAVTAEAGSAEVEVELPTEEVPEWLQEVESVPIEPPLEGAEPVVTGQEIPDWLLKSEAAPAAGISTEEEMVITDEVAVEEEAPPSDQPVEEKPAWLVEEELPAESALQEEVVVEEVVEEIPDWLKEISVASAVEVPEWLLEEEAPIVERPAEVGALEQIEPETISQEELREAEEEPLLVDDTQPSKVVSAEQIVVSPTEITEPVTEAVVAEVSIEEPAPLEIHEEVVSQLEEAPVEKELEAVTPVSEPGTPPTEKEPSAALSEEEAAFAWLEGLAVKQGAEEALLLKPEERLETPPEWIQRTMEEESKVKPETEIPPTIEEEAVSAEELPTATAIEGVEEAEVEALVSPELAEEVTEKPETIEAMEAVSPPPIQKIDLNLASLAELERLPGIGFITAQRIVDFRETYGPFSDLNDLLLMPDFNPATLDDLKDYLYAEIVEKAPTLPIEELVPAAKEGEAIAELQQAQKLLKEGDLEQALEEYAKLIQSGQSLPQIIQDLEEISHRHPQEMQVWQKLGDAYFRSDQLHQALKAYVEAERLL